MPFEYICQQCGEPFSRPQRSKTAKYCSTRCAGEARRGVSYAHKGGRTIHTDGYIMVLVPGTGKYVMEHRVVMAQHLGRPLLPTEVVHHRNHDKQDNRIENLELLTPTTHNHVHGKNGGWATGFDRCQDCGTTGREHLSRGLCQRCYGRAWYHDRLDDFPGARTG